MIISGSQRATNIEKKGAGDVDKQHQLEKRKEMESVPTDSSRKKELVNEVPCCVYKTK